MIDTPVEVGVLSVLSHDLQGFRNIQPVVGLGISEPSTVWSVWNTFMDETETSFFLVNMLFEILIEVKMFV